MAKAKERTYYGEDAIAYIVQKGESFALHFAGFVGNESVNEDTVHATMAEAAAKMLSYGVPMFRQHGYHGR